MAVIHGTQRPADDEPGMQIHDGRQIQLGAAADEELRRVADPTLIRTLGDEPSLEHTAGDGLIVIAHLVEWNRFRTRALSPSARMSRTTRLRLIGCLARGDR